MTDNSKNTLHKVRGLDQVFYIGYFLLFSNDIDKKKMLALINFRDNINKIKNVYITKFYF